ncbi:unnamed protein product [Rotaria socialis]
MHVAPRGGYSIKNSKQFIRRYESYLRSTLKIAQILLSAGNLDIPQPENVSIANSNTITLEMNTPEYRQDIEQRLKFVDILVNQIDGKQTSQRGENAREILTYLELVDDEHSLGKLDCAVTDDGHVRWVCPEHYDEVNSIDKLNSYINDFKVMGGKFDQKTREAVVFGMNVTKRNVKMICGALTKGFNIVKLVFQDCSFNEGYLETLLDTIINRSSIRCLNMTAVTVTKFFGGVKYTCKNMVVEFKNESLKIRFTDSYHNGNIPMLNQLLLRNKIHRTLNISACDFLGHESDLQRCFESNRTVTELIVKYSNNIDILNTIFDLKTNALHQLKLPQSLSIPSILSPFCALLKKNTTLVEIDLMDYTGFKEEAFIIKLLDLLREHKSIRYLSLHVEGIQLSNQKETYMIKSLRRDKFIARLCISASIVSREFIEALYHASKVNDTLTYMNFYDSQVNDEDKAQLHSLYETGNLLQLGFYEQSRWDVMFARLNERPSRVNIPANATWAQNGVTIAGGNGRGGATNQLYKPVGLFVDDDQTVVIVENGNHRIMQWKNGDTMNGQVVAGGEGVGYGLHQLYWPTDVLIDKETDSLIICDFGNRRVVRWPRRSGTTQGEILIDKIQCWGLAMDERRYLYVSDVEKHEVRRYKLGEKSYTLVAGGNGEGNGLNQLNWLTYLFVDRDHSVYVSDNNNHRVMKWNKGAKEGIVVAGGNLKFDWI